MAALRAMANASKDRSNGRITDVRCPVLVIMGTKDPDFPDPEAEARLIADRATDGTVVMIEGAGHYPPAEMPAETAQALAPFLDRIGERHRAG
jgi:pimeloyl-ACP methyl ester carboxylesterase